MVNVVAASGGGVKGARQVGYLEDLLRARGVTVDAWFGESTGSLLGAVMAQATSHGEQMQQRARLEGFYRSIRGNHDIVDIPWPGGTAGKIRGLLQGGGMYRFRGLREKLRAAVDPSLLRFGKPFRCGAVCLETGEYRTWGNADADVLDGVVASCAQPLMVPPEEIMGLHWVDGGVRHVSPVRDAVRWIRDNVPAGEPATVWVLMASPLAVKPARPPKWGLDVLNRSVGLLVHENTLGDLEGVAIRNAILAAGVPGLSFRHIGVQVYQPPAELTVDGYDFDPALIEAMLAEGKRARPVALESLLKDLAEAAS